MKRKANYGSLPANDNIVERPIHPSLSRFICFVFLPILFISIIIVTSTTYGIGLNTSNKEVSVNRPNIVIIMVDDLSWSSLYYEKSNIARYAPNILALQSEGVTISSYYSHAMCNPSRAAFVTGRYASNLGIQDVNISPTLVFGLNLSFATFARKFQNNSYKTHLLGKWHLGHMSAVYLPTARGYDSFLGYLGGEEFAFTKRLLHSDTIMDFIEMNKTCFHEYSGANHNNYSTYIYRDRALEIIDDYVESLSDETDGNNKGLLLQVAFQAVHRYFIIFTFAILISSFHFYCLCSPFADEGYENGLTSGMVGMEAYTSITSSVPVILQHIIARLLSILYIIFSNTYVYFVSVFGREERQSNMQCH
jgi:hypothetical protein